MEPGCDHSDVSLPKRDVYVHEVVTADPPGKKPR